MSQPNAVFISFWLFFVFANMHTRFVCLCARVFCVFSLIVYDFGQFVSIRLPKHTHTHAHTLYAIMLFFHFFLQLFCLFVCFFFVKWCCFLCLSFDGKRKMFKFHHRLMAQIVMRYFIVGCVI